MAVVPFRHSPGLRRSESNAGIKKTTNNFMNFLELLHLAFEGKLAANGGSNVKFAPQARTISAVS